MSTTKQPEYNVVFRYTKKAGGYAGVITWTSYRSKEELDKRREQILSASNQEVIAEGVTSEEAVALVRSTPLASRIRAALQESTMPDGDVDDEILSMHLNQVILSRIL